MYTLNNNILDSSMSMHRISHKAILPSMNQIVDRKVPHLRTTKVTTTKMTTTKVPTTKVTTTKVTRTTVTTKLDQKFRDIIDNTRSKISRTSGENALWHPC